MRGREACRRLILLALTCVVSALVFAPGAMASTCGSDANSTSEICGTDFSADSAVEFNGEVATYAIKSLGQIFGVALDGATIDWGDGTPTSSGTLTGDPTMGGTVTGTHTYAAGGLHTVSSHRPRL